MCIPLPWTSYRKELSCKLQHFQYAKGECDPKRFRCKFKCKFDKICANSCEIQTDFCRCVYPIHIHPTPDAPYVVVTGSTPAHSRKPSIVTKHAENERISGHMPVPQLDFRGRLGTEEE